MKCRIQDLASSCTKSSCSRPLLLHASYSPTPPQRAELADEPCSYRFVYYRLCCFCRVMSSSSGECSPVCSSPGPESVACYEECTTDETFELAASSSPLQSPGASGAGVDEEPSSVHRTASGGGSASHGVPKSTSSGRIAKRGSSQLASSTCKPTHTWIHS